MSETLAALHRAVIASPTDRTVRLVYADALEETGEPSHLGRAEFIRAQIELDSAASDPDRLGQLTNDAEKLFEEHWLAWWAPVAEAAGLPHPYVPGKRIRDRIARTMTRQRRAKNWPYTITAPDTTIHLADHGISFRFAGGFPEEVCIHRFTAPENEPELVHRWGDAIPLARLSLSYALSVTEWESVDGAHLSRLEELTLDSLLEGVAPRIAASPALANLRRLTVGGSDNLGAIVSRPIWEKLRDLRLTSPVTTENVRVVADTCTLGHLEELEISLGNPTWMIERMIRAASAGVLSLIQAFTQTVMSARDLSRWGDYGSALEALAAAKWIRQLRALRLVQASARGLFGRLTQPIEVQTAEEPLPDAALLALADAIRSDKLERLTLPAELVSLPTQEAMKRRMGPTVEFR
jgi:uncharacterized protein (TIGR02996 family)